jgi:hypothetical protein
MLETLGDIVTEITNRLGTTVGSTFFTPTKIQATAIDAYNWATSIYQWPQLEIAKITTTVKDQYYYDYPEGFIVDSVSRVIVDDDLYEIKNFDDFLNYKYIETGEKDLTISSDYGQQIFLYPTPTVDGLNIIIFGLQVATPLEDDDDETIFTHEGIMGNEAVVKKSLGVLLPQANRKQEGQAEEAEAIAILSNMYSKILKRQAKYQRLDKQMFEVPDYFAGNVDQEVKNNIGGF